MKLSEILKDWPEKKIVNLGITSGAEENCGFNTALTSCDREIDREALVKIIGEIAYADKCEVTTIADIVISTMPTWLKRSEK